MSREDKRTNNCEAPLVVPEILNIGGNLNTVRTSACRNMTSSFLSIDDKTCPPTRALVRLPSAPIFVVISVSPLLQALSDFAIAARFTDVEMSR